MRSEQSWSLLDPKPVLLYLENLDEYVVYWNGIAMTHTMALCMAMERAGGIYPTPEMKQELESTYHKVYYANGFQTRAWDNIVSSTSVYSYLKKLMKEHLEKTVDGKNASDVLKWFDYDRARTEKA